MRFPLSLFLALFACVVTTLVGATLYTVSIEQDAIDQSRQSHYDYVLKNLHNTIETNLALGLSLEQTAGLQRLLERENADLPEGLDISIYSHSIVLYSTSQAWRNEPIPAAWMNQSPDDIWCIEDTHDRSCGKRVFDELGQAAGGLVLTWPLNNEAYSLQAWLARGVPTLALLSLALLLTAAGTFIYTYRKLKPFQISTRILLGSKPELAARDPMIQAALQAQDKHLAYCDTLQQKLNRLKELDHAS